MPLNSVEKVRLSVKYFLHVYTDICISVNFRESVRDSAENIRNQVYIYIIKSWHNLILIKYLLQIPKERERERERENTRPNASSRDLSELNGWLCPCWPYQRENCRKVCADAIESSRSSFPRSY